MLRAELRVFVCILFVLGMATHAQTEWPAWDEGEIWDGMTADVIRTYLEQGADPDGPVEFPSRPGAGVWYPPVPHGDIARYSPLVRLTVSVVRGNLHYDPESFGLLIDAGANPNALDDDDYSAIDIALRNGEHEGLVHQLLDADAEPTGYTLYSAARNSAPEVVQRIIARVDDVDWTHSMVGTTPLFMAASHNPDPEIVRLLLQAEADVNATVQPQWWGSDDDDMTPLMGAARDNPNPEVIQTLIDSGADLNARDVNGETALTHAVRRDDGHVVYRILVDAGAESQ